MLKEQLQAFLEAVKGDTALQARIQDTTDLDAIVAIAMEAGFVVSKQELEAAQALELSEGELETISGGLRKAVGGNKAIGGRKKPPGGDDDLDDLEVERNR
jgi:predicted ribosomally synthesized peptide with nif11-like leader